ncbi:purine-binding chemotaxis protein CheW [Methylorubrum rhodinum]|uniref:Purine-binding chemotaxis protein CheW n=1 Tax=Methylorubrum rhodinum TaxID=29428 RepID=A0A840ZEZ1_9HYPH|nr:chemotaxis protein CheW [Methylorubrum rhodinum]MBB5755748.1 purine-binding chemotaxis protein CheW [Methylorubrum rhodinum]
MKAALDARTDALLESRAAALAARSADRARAVETTGYLVCACGPERYGLPLASIAGVMPERPCTALPGAPPALRGICAMAGTIVSVLDLSACLGLAMGSGEGHLVRLRGQEVAVALGVDRVLGIARIEAVPADPAEVLGGEPLLGYVPPASDRTGDVRDGFTILDLPALLARFLT